LQPSPQLCSIHQSEEDCQKIILVTFDVGAIKICEGKIWIRP